MAEYNIHVCDTRLGQHHTCSTCPDLSPLVTPPHHTTSWTEHNTTQHVHITSWTEHNTTYVHVHITSCTEHNTTQHVNITSCTEHNKTQHVHTTSWTEHNTIQHVHITSWTEHNTTQHVHTTSWTEHNTTQHVHTTLWTWENTQHNMYTHPLYTLWFPILAKWMWMDSLVIMQVLKPVSQLLMAEIAIFLTSTMYMYIGICVYTISSNYYVGMTQVQNGILYIGYRGAHALTS